MPFRQLFSKKQTNGIALSNNPGETLLIKNVFVVHEGKRSIYVMKCNRLLVFGVAFDFFVSRKRRRQYSEAFDP
jgi:hypothetical protein